VERRWPSLFARQHANSTVVAGCTKPLRKLSRARARVGLESNNNNLESEDLASMHCNSGGANMKKPIMLLRLEVWQGRCQTQ
jgi:hypothetical protein